MTISEIPGEQSKDRHSKAFEAELITGGKRVSGVLAARNNQPYPSRHRIAAVHCVLPVAPVHLDLCDYVNENWRTKPPIHLAAYCLWRLNWIHPFTDGNGRTARALCYLVLCVSLGYKLPGANTIPDQISKDKSPYYKALESADLECKNERVDLSQLQDYLSELLANQLYSVHKQATLNARSTPG
jgi:Fic family protein